MRKYNINGLVVRLRKYTLFDLPFVYNTSKKSLYSYAMNHLGNWKGHVGLALFNNKDTKILIHNSKRIGFYQLGYYEHITSLANIQIIEPFRNRGLGTFLLNLAEQETIMRGCKKMELKVFLDNPAKRLYCRLGYKHPYNEFDGRVHLEKILTTSQTVQQPYL